MNDLFQYGTGHLTVKNVTAIASRRIKAVLGEEAKQKIRTSEESVRQIIADKKTVYGINTGFGILANTPITEKDTATLQFKILQSHSVGVGEPVSPEIARIMMITKVHALAQGFSGV